MSEGDGGTYQPVDQRAIDAMRMTPGLSGMMGAALNAATRAADNAALAQTQQAGGAMRVDPDQVDKLARFFRDEAEALRKRRRDVSDLAVVDPPGTDPVSTQASEKYGQVASGNPQAYLDNYLKLADAFDHTALNLEGSAKQWRTNDGDAAAGMGGVDRA
ncbi:hypothetical protein AB0I53_01635 [Saccharopolyspora sp. NPDC050389]|uniref:hypothetical protein n=1 Tax=Saccharopolyspora sp. NPDC050389 TaxID=3155516 RepID=UPI0033EB403A